MAAAGPQLAPQLTPAAFPTPAAPSRPSQPAGSPSACWVTSRARARCQQTCRTGAIAAIASTPNEHELAPSPQSCSSTASSSSARPGHSQATLAEVKKGHVIGLEMARERHGPRRLPSARRRAIARDIRMLVLLPKRESQNSAPVRPGLLKSSRLSMSSGLRRMQEPAENPAALLRLIQSGRLMSVRRGARSSAMRQRRGSVRPPRAR
jgi:hypothetical protein